MKLPIDAVISMLEAEMTEEKCDALAETAGKFLSSHGGVVGKLTAGIVRGGIDAVTPEILFKALHAIFPEGHTAEIPAGAEVTE